MRRCAVCELPFAVCLCTGATPQVELHSSKEHPTFETWAAPGSRESLPGSFVKEPLGRTYTGVGVDAGAGVSAGAWLS